MRKAMNGIGGRLLFVYIKRGCHYYAINDVI